MYVEKTVPLARTSGDNCRDSRRGHVSSQSGAQSPTTTENHNHGRVEEDKYRERERGTLVK